MVHLERRHAALVATLVSQLRGVKPTEKIEESYSRLEDAVQDSIAQADEQALIRWLAKTGTPILDSPKECSGADTEGRGLQPSMQQESLMSMLGRALAPIDHSLNALLGKLQDSGSLPIRNSVPAVGASNFATAGHHTGVPENPILVC